MCTSFLSNRVTITLKDRYLTLCASGELSHDPCFIHTFQETLLIKKKQ